jgi:tRNA-2-methylthio-N6-dimethylallyladenosine synthase
MRLVADVQFDGAFSFAYSPRPGTPAAELADPVPPDVQQARLMRLSALLDAQYRAFSDAMVGTRQRALVTGCAARDGRELCARTDNNRVVNFAGDASLVGHYADLTITVALAHSLRGELIAA